MTPLILRYSDVNGSYIYDQTSNMKKAIIIGLLLFGMNIQANSNDPIKDQESKQIEYLKKAKYYELKAKLEAGINYSRTSPRTVAKKS